MKKIEFPNGKFAICDDDDYDFIKSLHPTCLSDKKINNFYLIGKKDSKRTMLVRLLLNVKKGELVNYINNEPLDIRRSNLRIINYAQKCQLSLKNKQKLNYVGVKLVNSGNYVSTIRDKGRIIYLGTFEFAKDAAEAYNKKAKELYGELAYQNKI